MNEYQYQPQYQQPQMYSMLTAPPCAAGTYNIPVLNKCASKTEVAIGAGAVVLVLYLMMKK